MLKNHSSGAEYPKNGRRENGNAARPLSAMASSSEEEISLAEVLEILRKGKWLILACFLLVLTATAVYTFLKAPEYEASSVLYVNSQQSAPQLGELLGLERASRNIANEIAILQSRNISTRVAERLMDLQVLPGTDQPLTVLENEEEEPLTPLAVAGRLRENYLEVGPVSDDVDLIEVTATSTIPAEARLIANLYAEEFVEFNRSSSRQRMTASREFLDEVTERFETGLREAEDQLTAFLNRESVVAPDEEARQLLEQVMELQQLQYQMQLERGQRLAELHALQEELERITPGLAEQISSGDNLLIERLKQEIANLQLEEQQIYARNPERRGREPRTGRLAEIEQEIGQLREQLIERAERVARDALRSGAADAAPATLLGGGATGVVQELRPLQQLQQQVMAKEIELSGIQAGLDVVGEELAQYRAQLSSIPNKAILLKRLERTQQTQEQLYLALLEKMQEARIAEQSELGYIEVIDPAIMPGGAVRPRIRINLLLGTILGLVLGIGLAFVRSAVDNKIREPEDLRKRGFSVLGAIPNMARVIKSDFEGRERVTIDGHTYSTRLIALLNPLSPIVEGYRGLRTNIQFSRPDKIVQTIVVTSSEPGEGKTTTSANLAVTMAQTGRRTLLLDADLRNPSIAPVLGVSRAPGLVDLLFENTAPVMSRFATEIDDLYVLPAGSKAPNPAEILGSQKMRAFLTRLREEFDAIIIDAPPVLAVTDPLLLASQADATVLVCSAGTTNQYALERSAEILQHVDAELVGVLMNRYDAKGGRYGYSYGYGYGYGSKQQLTGQEA